jgi:hypothetical protein
MCLKTPPQKRRDVEAINIAILGMIFAFAVLTI